MLGHVLRFVSPRHEVRFGAAFEERPAGTLDMLDEFGNEFRQTPSGAKLAKRLQSALDILMRNAVRLESFVEHAAERLQTKGGSGFEQPLLTLVKEFEDAQAQTARLSVPAEGPVADAKVEKEAQPAATQQEPARSHGPIPAKQRATEPRQRKPIATPPADARASEGKGAALGLHAVHSGAKPKGQPAHWHKSEQRGLARGEKVRRLQTIEAWELGLLTTKYQKLTPEIQAALADRSQARRMAERGTTDISAGQKLVQPPRLHG